MTAPTPCRGQSAVYDAALDGQVRSEKRLQAQTIAAALCGRCPIAHTCPDRITPPADRTWKDTATVTVTDITPSRPEPNPAPTTPEELIAWGTNHQSARNRNLADKAVAAIAELQQAAERETKVATAEARIARLKAQLANAEQDLRKAKSGTTNPTGKQAATGHRLSTEDLRTIRKWAAANGHQVAPKGVIARSVIEAYRAANPSLANAS